MRGKMFSFVLVFIIARVTFGCQPTQTPPTEPEPKIDSFTQGCWGDYRLKFAITGETVINATCVEDGLTSLFSLTSGEEISVTLSEDFGSLDAKIGEEPVLCKKYTRDWACSGKYEFAVTIESPKELTMSGGNELLTIHYPDDLAKDLKSFPMASGYAISMIINSADNTNWSQEFRWNPVDERLSSVWRENDVPRYLAFPKMGVCYDGVMFTKHENGYIKAVDCSPPPALETPPVPHWWLNT